jgi:hypothetical protein
MTRYNPSVGTNYYLHIGKRTSQGVGHPPKFSWAVGRGRGVLEHFGDTAVIDEYGNEMTWAEFYMKIQADVSDESTIGDNFS